MGCLNIYLVFLKGDIFTAVVHVCVGNFPLCKSAVICDKVIFWSCARQLPNILKDSNWKCREKQLRGGNSGCNRTGLAECPGNILDSGVSTALVGSFFP